MRRPGRIGASVIPYTRGAVGVVVISVMALGASVVLIGVVPYVAVERRNLLAAGLMEGRELGKS
jgi:hypothetical protein